MGEKLLDVAGLDISQELIEIARTMFPHGRFFVHNLAQGARHPALEDSYDFVVSNAVFHYLSLEEARELFRDSLRLANRKVLVSELPHIDRKSESEALRERAMSPGEYVKKYSQLHHTYFHPDLFQQVVGEQEFRENWGLHITDSSVFPNGQSELRFCAVASRKQPAGDVLFDRLGR